jgi:hypothetical protein
MMGKLCRMKKFKKKGMALKIIRTANALEGYKRVNDLHKSFYQ